MTDQQARRPIVEVPVERRSPAFVERIVRDALTKEREALVALLRELWEAPKVLHLPAEDEADLTKRVLEVIGD